VRFSGASSFLAMSAASDDLDKLGTGVNGAVAEWLSTDVMELDGLTPRCDPPSSSDLSSSSMFDECDLTISLLPNQLRSEDSAEKAFAFIDCVRP